MAQVIEYKATPDSNLSFLLMKIVDNAMADKSLVLSDFPCAYSDWHYETLRNLLFHSLNTEVIFQILLNVMI